MTYHMHEKQREMFASGGTGRPTRVARARRTDPDTSHEAAARASLRLRDSQWSVLSLFARHYPLSYNDPELVSTYRYAAESGMYNLKTQSPSGIRSRRAELGKMGLLQFAGRQDGFRRWVISQEGLSRATLKGIVIGGTSGPEG